MKIERSTDSRLLAKLNKEVQDFHADIEPKIYKSHDEDSVAGFFEKYLKKDNVFAFVAFSDELPAGYVFLIKRDYPEGPFTKRHLSLFIDQICVLEKYRGNGIGKALIGFTKQFASDNDIDRIELECWNKNSNAGDFFKHQGFEAYSEKMRF